ncbi:hypothetical protein [Variovorax sp.]|uniref:hypothetical protein n=1 Tax=Variovorax sp. TaxID=1871043 RepID=UPI002D470F14|nr:hypothetical protein [Variovorax sp.]HYP83742.1 hypothetical protein [Variovorax sp.]
MSGLTKRDMQILKAYAFDRHNRELYWNYLAQLPGNDGYGLLALGVVRNDNMPGAVANSYAQHHAYRHDGRVLSEHEWEKFGQLLIQHDYDQREQAFFKGHSPEQALNLPVKAVQRAHDLTFESEKLDPNAWTPRVLLEAARTQDGEVAAERVWSQLLDNARLGLNRAWNTSEEIVRYLAAPEATRYMGSLAAATLEASQSLPATDPDRIGNQHQYYKYDEVARQWGSMRSGIDGAALWPASVVTDPVRIRELDDTRALRLQNQEKAQQFMPDDPYRVHLRSPQTLASKGDDPARTHAAERAMDGPFGNPLLNLACHAASQGDEALLSEAARLFAQSDQGQDLQRLGARLLAEQQAQERVQAQRAQEKSAPVLVLQM